VVYQWAAYTLLLLSFSGKRVYAKAYLDLFSPLEPPLNFKDHPQFKAMAADVALANQAEEQERVAAQLEQQRLRQQQAQLLNRDYQARVEEYEELRKMVHAKLGEIWRVATEYQRLTSQYPPTFLENTFMSVDIPSLLPSNQFSSPFSTTRASVMAWFSSLGKGWT
jgi:hypothetical protein